MSETGGIDVRRAFHTYVIGRDAGFDPDLKEELAESRLEKESAAGRAPASTSASVPGSTPAAASSSTPEVASVDDTGSRPPFGVPVPERLVFHRSASRWRDLIPGLRGGGA